MLWDAFHASFDSFVNVTMEYLNMWKPLLTAAVALCVAGCKDNAESVTETETTKTVESPEGTTTIKETTTHETEVETDREQTTAKEELEKAKDN